MNSSLICYKLQTYCIQRQDAHLSDGSLPSTPECTMSSFSFSNKTHELSSPTLSSAPVSTATNNSHWPVSLTTNNTDLEEDHAINSLQEAQVIGGVNLDESSSDKVQSSVPEESPSCGSEHTDNSPAVHHHPSDNKTLGPTQVFVGENQLKTSAHILLSHSRIPAFTNIALPPSVIVSDHSDNDPLTRICSVDSCDAMPSSWGSSGYSADLLQSPKFNRKYSDSTCSSDRSYLSSDSSYSIDDDEYYESITTRPRKLSLSVSINMFTIIIITHYETRCTGIPVHVYHLICWINYTCILGVLQKH